MEDLLGAIDVYLFYFLAACIIHFGFYYGSGCKHWMSWIYSALVVIVSSEFWEIPIFLMAYEGMPGYSAPHIYNHLIVLVMAILLLALSKFRLDLWNGSSLAVLMVFNFISLLIFPGLFSAWILRGINLIVLAVVFMREVWRHG